MHIKNIKLFFKLRSFNVIVLDFFLMINLGKIFVNPNYNSIKKYNTSLSNILLAIFIDSPASCRIAEINTAYTPGS